MFGAKSTILVSISIGHEQATSEDGKHYMRPRHTWMISAQPHKSLISGHKAMELVHYTSFHDPHSGAHIVQRTDGGRHGVVGSIELTHSAHTSPDEVLQILQDRVHKSIVQLPAEASPDDVDSEAWVRGALHTLQHDKVVDHFDVDEFMTFAHSYLGTRTDGNGGTAPAVVEYPRLHAKKEKKEGGGWRVSYPTQNTNRDGEKVYGGLM